MVILGLSALAVSARLVRTPSNVDPSTLITPREVSDDGYVGSDACSACHPYQHATWHASYHRTMTQVATERTVLAPFDGTELHLEGVTWRVEQRGDEHWVTGVEPRPDGSIAQLEKRVVMTTGSHNYQMYWLEGEGASGMIPFPLVYLLYDRVWIPRKSRFLTPPVERTPIETGRWRIHCIKCHATRGQPHDAESGATRVAELGIACEACHGPGAEHARRNRDPLRRFRLYAGDDPDPTMTNPARLAHDRSTQVCGQCHAIEVFLTPEKAEDWRRFGSRYRPGDALSEHQTIVSGRYDDNPPDVRAYIDDHAVFDLRNCFWPDGMLRVAGREYHGMLETPCYRAGEMSCLSCHRLHRAKYDARELDAWADDQLGAEMDGDTACTQCHERYRDAGAAAAHTHHDTASSGSRCMNCHMSYTTWGLLRAIRSHTVDSPNVSTTLATGRPNPCNQCHLNRTLAWTAERLDEWYGQEPPALSPDGQGVAASILWALSGDAVQRALMAWSMGWEAAREVSGTQWMVPYLSALLVDPYDAVRFNAQRSLRRYPEYRAMMTDSIVGATRERQSEMMSTALSEWTRRFPGSGGESGAHLLILPDARIDRDRFARLAGARKDHDLVLFE